MSASTTAATQLLIQQLQSSRSTDRDAALNALVGIVYERITHLAHLILRRQFPRVVSNGVDTVGVVSEVYQRMLLAFRDPAVIQRIQSLPDFLSVARQHIRWTLLEEARKLDRRPGTIPIDPSSGGASGPLFEDSGINPVHRAQVAELFDAMDTLPEEQRETVTLVWIFGYSRTEVAEFLGKDEATIRRWLRKAEEKLFLIFDGTPPF